MATKTLPGWTFVVFAVLGAALIGSMALTWAGEDPFAVSGYVLATQFSKWLLLVPISGVCLLLLALTKSPHVRLAALAAGVVTVGYLLFVIALSMMHGGADLYMIIGGATALVIARKPQRAPLRALAGLVIIVGFFAPWTARSAFRFLIQEHTGLELFIHVFWLILVGGILGVASAFAKQKATTLAVTGAVLVFAAFATVLAIAVIFVLHFGSWIALGAGVLSMIVALVAPRTPTAPGPEAKLVSAGAS